MQKYMYTEPHKQMQKDMCTEPHKQMQKDMHKRVESFMSSKC